MKNNRYIRIIAVILFSMFSFCGYTVLADENVMNWQLINNEHSEVDDVPLALNNNKVSAYPIEIGKPLKIEYSFQIPKDFGEIVMANGRERYKYSSIEIIYTSDHPLIFAGTANFSVEHGKSIQLSANPESEVPSVNTLNGVPIEHVWEGQLLKIAIGPLDFDKRERIMLQNPSKEMTDALNRMAGKTIYVSGNIALDHLARPDVAYQAYAQYVANTFEGEQVEESQVSTPLVTFGRKFVRVDSDTSQAIEDKQNIYVIQNKNVDSLDFDKYYAYDKRTNTLKWVTSIDDSNVKEYHLGKGEHAGEFDVVGIVGDFELVEKEKATNFEKNDVGIRFQASLGTSSQSGGTLEYTLSNGTPATEMRQTIRAIQLYDIPKTYDKNTKYSSIFIGILIIGVIFISMLIIRKVFQEELPH